MRGAWTTAGAEPALEDVLADPIVALVMRCDGIATPDVLRAVRTARRRMTRANSHDRARVPFETEDD